MYYYPRLKCELQCTVYLNGVLAFFTSSCFTVFTVASLLSIDAVLILNRGADCVMLCVNTANMRICFLDHESKNVQIF